MISRLIGSLRSQVCRQSVGSVYLSTVTHSPVETSTDNENINASKTPLITSRDLQFPPKEGRVRRTWVENMDSVKEEKLGIIDLHPEIFAVPPRLDIMLANVRWQELYRKVNWKQVPNRAEMPGGGRKPWPQKGLGKARHGSIRSPLFRLGGKAHGPRAPNTYFYMLPFSVRLLGLTTTLSTKLAQDDLHVVKSLDIPTSDPLFIQDLVEERLWGPSVLFVDVSDIAPENLALATEQIKHMNIMPLYGLNVFSLLKYDTVVLTLSAIEELETKLLFHVHSTESRSRAEPHRNNEF